MFKTFFSNTYENIGVTSAYLLKLIRVFQNDCLATENALHAIARRLKCFTRGFYA